jgi:hypothetical protein
MEGNILSGGVKDLNDIKNKLLELNEYQEKNDVLNAEEVKLEKSIKNKEKAITEEITGTSKKRKDEIEGTYDEQLEKTRARIKKIRNRKEKSKSEKISERILYETADLREEYQSTAMDIKTIIKQNKIPSICKTRLFYSLYFPKRTGDIMIILLSLIIILLALPSAIYLFLLPKGNMFYLILIYMLTVICFGGSYMLVDAYIKNKHLDSLKKILKLRQSQKFNKRRQKGVRNNILKDKDESKYGLDNFDQELTELDKELNTIGEQKKDALSVFENTTRFVIGEEIKARYQEELVSLKQEYGKAYVEIKDTEDKIKNLIMELVNTYEAYIGKEFMNVEKLDALAEIMEENQIKTISEAITYFKENKQPDFNLFK